MSVSSRGVGVDLEVATCVCCGNAVRFDEEAAGHDYLYETTPQRFRFVRCLDCGHLLLSPRPAFSAAKQIYPSHYYTLSGGHEGGTLGVIKDWIIVRRLRRFMPHGHAKVADVGCGDGALLLALKRSWPDCALTAVDLQFSPAHRDRLERAGITVVEAAVERADLGCDRFDLVVLNQVIEHLWDVPGVLRSIHAALTSGGLLAISTPNPNGYDRRLFFQGTWGGYYFPRHFNLFTPQRLADLLHRASFEVVRTKPLLAPLIWTASLQGALRARGSNASTWITDRNVAALTVFSLLDLIALSLGLETSNQQCVARRS